MGKRLFTQDQVMECIRFFCKSRDFFLTEDIAVTENDIIDFMNAGNLPAMYEGSTLSITTPQGLLVSAEIMSVSKE